MTTKTTKPLIWLTTLILTTLTATLPTSCSDYTPEFDEAAYKYNQSFIDLFGNIDPNQNWNLVRQLAEKNGGGSTRALVPDISQDDANVSAPELNHWYKNEYNLKVPGFPNYAGIYHYRFNDNDNDPVCYASRDKMWENNEDKIEKYHPVGDVTEEEILYVSEWFRSNRYPKSEKVHWKNFFVQNISHDCDRTVTTVKIVGDDGKEKEIETCKDGTPLFQYRDAQDNKTKIKQDANAKSFGMDQLTAQAPDGKWAHVSNFNNGRSNDFSEYIKAPSYTDPKGTANPAYTEPTTRVMQLFVGAGTERFAYISSYSTKIDNSNVYDEHVLVHLQFSIEQTGSPYCEIHEQNCSVHDYDGYYLGFDLEAVNGNEIWEPDGFYSNWIIKLTYTPWVGDPDLTEDYDPEVIEQGLLVCEDLGDFDYDFNDVVLKLEHRQAKKENSENATGGSGNDGTTAEIEEKLIITAMAAGGTLPSYIYFDPNKDSNGKEELLAAADESINNEIHVLLGSTSLTPINAGPKFGKEGLTWEYTLKEGEWDKVNYSSGFVSQVFETGRIQIHVGSPDGEKVIKTANKDDGTFESDAPQMMLLPVYFEWPQEMRRIDLGYQNFSDWVKNANETHWIYYQTDKEKNITERNVSKPIPSTGVTYPGLYAMFYGTIIYSGQTILLPPDDSDIVYVDLCSNSNGRFSIRVENNENDAVEVELVNGNQLKINNKAATDENVTVHIEQEAYSSYTSASMTIIIKDLTTGKLRWRNGTVDGLKSIDIIAGEPTIVPYAAADNNTNSVEMSVENTNNCFEAEKDEENSFVTITGTSMGKGTITLTQGTETAPLAVTVYEKVEENAELKEKGYSPATIYYTDNTCQVFATTYYYDYPLGALLIVDKNVTIKDNVGNEISFKSKDGEYYVYELSVLELEQLSKTPTHPNSTSPLILSGADANQCKVYVRGITMEDLYGTPVEYEESQERVYWSEYYSEIFYKYTISSEQIPATGGTITFIPQLGNNNGMQYTFDFNDSDRDAIQWTSWQNGKNIEKVVQNKGDVILWTNTQLEKLQVFIKPTSLAKKRK